ncbi:MAG: hypothetical protein F4Z01_08315 [Gammaproteobacteria bacterium]|nr:hypothetical protein [Gammaproteobacteria bacterium]
MTNKNRVKLDRRQIKIMLGVVAIGYLTIALTLAGILIVYGNISNLVLGIVFVPLVVLVGCSFVLSRALKQLSNQ